MVASKLNVSAIVGSLLVRMGDSDGCSLACSNCRLRVDYVRLEVANVGMRICSRA